MKSYSHKNVERHPTKCEVVVSINKIIALMTLKVVTIIRVKNVHLPLNGTCSNSKRIVRAKTVTTKIDQTKRIEA